MKAAVWVMNEMGKRCDAEGCYAVNTKVFDIQV